MAGCKRAAVWATALTLAYAGCLSAQTITVGDPLEDYLRVLQISGGVSDLGSFTVRPLAGSEDAIVVSAAAHPWSSWLSAKSAARSSDELRIDLVAPQLRAFANSRYPVGGNDGAVWQGRGLTTALDFGAVLRWRGLTVEARPTVVFNQNSDIDLQPVGGASPWVYPWRVIDLPQQFGPDAFWSLDPGQSEIRVDAWGASAGLSSKSLWWGPALRNPILISNNAPGFPHGFLGTDGPLDVRIGTLEARWIWGRLHDSGWMDPAIPNTDRFLTGLVAAYSPSFAEGLTLGATRVFYAWVPSGGVPVSDYFLVFQGVRKKGFVTPDNPTGDDEHDQMLSIFGRWALAESGFEVYGEWSRNDHSWEIRDFILEPEHSQGYTLGLRKSFDVPADRTLVVGAELTKLEQSTTVRVRAAPTYYAHHIVTQGYTQRGQLIGASVGPGGNAQSLSADLYTGWGRVGTWIERQVRDNDAYYERATDPAFFNPYCCHDVSLHWGTHALWFKGDWELGAGMIATHEYNRWFYGLSLWNLNLSASAKWHPR